MFNDAAYRLVNREERHFGFLFGSAIIYDSIFRKRVFERLNERLRASLQAEKFDIFMEVAALRDFWCHLGDSKCYCLETHASRKRVLETILADRGYDPAIIDQQPVFWTNGQINTGKLWSPSHWSEKKLEAIERCKNDLTKVRWCFNAKPDILLVSNNNAVFIEVKVESGAGKNDQGYDQLEIQSLISRYMKMLIPAFKSCSFFNTSLTLADELNMNGLTWPQVLSDLEQSQIKNEGSRYIYESLTALKRYSALK